MTRVKKQEIRKEGEEEKNMQVARGSKRRRGMRKAVWIYSPSCPSNRSGVVGRYLQL